MIKWAQKVGLKECPYLIRWVWELTCCSFRLHYWKASDDSRYMHDHSWWFITFVLWGTYIDVSDEGIEFMYPGKIMFRRAKYKHCVAVPKKCLTFMITGRKIRRYGFWVKGKFVKFNKYFFQFGHHPCNDGDEPVKTPTPKIKIERG